MIGWNDHLQNIDLQTLINTSLLSKKDEKPLCAVISIVRQMIDASLIILGNTSRETR